MKLWKEPELKELSVSSTEFHSCNPGNPDRVYEGFQFYSGCDNKDENGNCNHPAQ